jgi:hypothetical protein
MESYRVGRDSMGKFSFGKKPKLKTEELKPENTSMAVKLLSERGVKWLG